MIEAIVLDLDDTLYLERDYVRSGFTHIALELGRAGAGHEKQLFEHLWSGFEAGRSGDAFDSLIDEFDLEDVAVEELVDMYRNHSPAISLSEPRVLAELHGAMPLALITDGPEITQKAKIEALGLEEIMSQVLLTGEWGREFWKPHPRAFQAVEDQLGLSRSQLVYLGDNPRKDFETPNRRGWSTVRLRRRGQLHYDLEPLSDGAAPGHEVGSLAEFVDRLGSL